MAKSDGQKLKLLYLRDYLERNSSQAHPVSAQRLAGYLKEQGISCDRKTVYADIRALQEYGLDIENLRGPGGGFYLASGAFELPELKLLVDTVRSARFLTQRKSNDLIKKLLHLCNRYEEQLLRRQVVISGRVKSMNESIYYNLDAIQEAIAQNRKILFQYFDWDVGHQQRFRPGPYQASPYALCQDSENYYLLAYTQRHGVTHYRVDRMLRIELSKEPRIPCPALTGQALGAYGKKVFQMFAGETTPVKMRFANRLAGVIYDRFGGDAMLIPDGSEHFTYTAEVAVSPTFLSWVIGFGDQAQILYPSRVAQQCADLCRQALAQCTAAATSSLQPHHR